MRGHDVERSIAVALIRAPPISFAGKIEFITPKFGTFTLVEMSHYLFPFHLDLFLCHDLFFDRKFASCMQSELQNLVDRRRVGGMMKYFVPQLLAQIFALSETLRSSYKSR